MKVFGILARLRRSLAGLSTSSTKAARLVQSYPATQAGRRAQLVRAGTNHPDWAVIEQLSVLELQIQEHRERLRSQAGECPPALDQLLRSVLEDGTELVDPDVGGYRKLLRHWPARRPLDADVLAVAADSLTLLSEAGAEVVAMIDTAERLVPEFRVLEKRASVECPMFWDSWFTRRHLAQRLEQARSRHEWEALDREFAVLRDAYHARQRHYASPLPSSAGGGHGRPATGGVEADWWNEVLAHLATADATRRGHLQGDV